MSESIKQFKMLNVNWFRVHVVDLINLQLYFRVNKNVDVKNYDDAKILYDTLWPRHRLFDDERHEALQKTVSFLGDVATIRQIPTCLLSGPLCLAAFVKENEPEMVGKLIAGKTAFSIVEGKKIAEKLFGKDYPPYIPKKIEQFGRMPEVNEDVVSNIYNLKQVKGVMMFKVEENFADHPTLVEVSDALKVFLLDESSDTAKVKSTVKSGKLDKRSNFKNLSKSCLDFAVSLEAIQENRSKRNIDELISRGEEILKDARCVLNTKKARVERRDKVNENRVMVFKNET